ncbi:MAG: zinc-binding dehydrogenase [Proteobacteria bacterium]|nr:zinc-binding dehydrogenase [Pseudomonadota bacterium]
MRAVLKRDTKLVLEEIEAPKPTSGQALVRTLHCGICGTDLHALRHFGHLIEISKRAGLPIAASDVQPIVFGHEFCAELIGYGPGTERRLPPGTRVVAMPTICGPAGAEFVGYSNRFPGGFAERMLLSADRLIPVPDGLSSRQAALVEPLAVGVHAVARAQLERDSVIMLIGAGPIGLAVLSALRAEGLGPVVVADYSPFRRGLAEAMGADRVVDPAEHSPHELWEGLLSGIPRGARRPVVFECVGRPGVLQSIVDGVPRGTRVLVVGNCLETDVLEPYVALTKELNLSFCNMYTGAEFAGTLEHLAEGRIDADLLITGVVDLEGVAGAFEALADPERHAKILVEP